MAHNLPDALAQIKTFDQKVYFLHGAESYFIDTFSTRILAELIPEHEKSFCESVVFGKDVKTAQVIGLARQFPFMGEKQLILVKEAQEVSDLDKDEGHKLLLEYMAQPTPTTCLVFCYKYKKLDLRKAGGKALDKAGVLYESATMADREIPNWITALLKKNALAYKPAVPGLLAACIGTDLQRIENEIGKMKINLGQGATIDEEMVFANIGISKDFNVFELQKALIDRNFDKAFQIAQYFGNNTKEHSIIKEASILSAFFLRLLQFNSLKSAGKESEATSTLKVAPFMLQEYQRASNAYGLAASVELVDAFYELDIQAKGAGVATFTEFEIWHQLILKFMGLAKRLN